MIDETEMLVLLKQARTALKVNQPGVALERVREAIKMIEPVPPREPAPSRAT